MSLELAKINEKFRGDYLAVNIRETDIYEEGLNDGILEGIQQGITQGITQGIEQGIEQKAIETAKQGLLLNLSYEQISQLTGLSLEIVEQLAKEQSNQN